MQAAAHSRRCVAALFGALLAVLSLGAVQARAAGCSVSWTGGHGELWSNEANWSTHALPAEGSNVCIDGSSVVLNYYTHVNSISIGSTAKLLIDGQPAYTHGQLELSEQSAGSGVAAGGVLELGSTNNEVTGGTHGGVVVKAGTLVNEGTITSANTNDETPNYINGNFDNLGTLVIDNHFEGRFADWTTSGLIRVEPGQEAVISEAGTGASFTQTGGRIINQGSFEQAGGTFAATGAGIAEGNPLVLSGRVAIVPSGSGSGSFHLKSGAATLAAGIAAGYTVWSSGEPGYTHGLLTIAGNLTNSGTLELGSPDGTHGTIEASGGTLTNDGTVVFANTMNGPDSLNGTLVNNDVLRLAGPVTGAGQITNAGLLTLASGATLEASSLSESGAGAALALSVAAATASAPPITVNGPISLGGAVSVGASGLASGTYPLITAKSRTGTFASASVSPASLAVLYTASGVTLGPPAAVAPPAGTAKLLALKGAARSVLATLACPAAGGACRATIRVTVLERLRHGKVVALSAKAPTKRTVTIASTTITIPAGTSRRAITLTLNAVGKALLAAHHRLKAIATITSNGHTLRTETVVITTPAKKRR